MLGDTEGMGDEGEVARGDEDGKWGEEEDGLREEDGCELKTRSDGRDPLAGSSPAPKWPVSTLDSGSGGSGRRGDFKGLGSRVCAAVARGRGEGGCCDSVWAPGPLVGDEGKE
jgi:hypothetical protein